MTVTIEYIYVRGDTDINPPDGYFLRDYFTSDLDEIAHEADDAETADAWLRSAYKGPDIDGIGVQWQIDEKADDRA